MLKLLKISLLKITATENVRTSVSSGAGEGRIVDFECGVSLTKQFPKPGVEFIITAPDDQEMQNIINTGEEPNARTNQRLSPVVSCAFSFPYRVMDMECFLTRYNRTQSLVSTRSKSGAYVSS